MIPPVTSPVARDSLRRLASPHANDFSCRLLDRGTDGVLTFQEFLAVAREIVGERPNETAIYLAALVALDIGAPDDDDLRRTPSPSSN
jgi:hypothetical protein